MTFSGSRVLTVRPPTPLSESVSGSVLLRAASPRGGGDGLQVLCFPALYGDVLPISFVFFNYFGRSGGGLRFSTLLSTSSSGLARTVSFSATPPAQKTLASRQAFRSIHDGPTVLRLSCTYEVFHLTPAED